LTLRTGLPEPIMPSIKFTTKVHAEPEATEVLDGEPSDSEEKQSNNRFSIDFEVLGQVLVKQGIQSHSDEHNEAEGMGYNEIRKKSCYALSTTSANYTKQQRIILYSPSFGSTFQTTCFSELNLVGADLPSIFSEELEHLWWMNVQNPSEIELRLLCSAFRVHPLTVEDILNREIQEKIEDFTHYYFASFRSYRVEDTTLEKSYVPYTIYMVVFPRGTLSFCFDDSEHADHVLQRIQLLKDYVIINSDWIFYAFV
jgi:Mg2+ and Co2+ transporter CorA